MTRSEGQSAWSESEKEDGKWMGEELSTVEGDERSYTLLDDVDAVEDARLKTARAGGADLFSPAWHRVCKRGERRKFMVRRRLAVGSLYRYQDRSGRISPCPGHIGFAIRHQITSSRY